MLAKLIFILKHQSWIDKHLTVCLHILPHGRCLRSGLVSISKDKELTLMFSFVPCKVAFGFQNKVSLGVYGRLFFWRWERGNSVRFKCCVPVSVLWALPCLIVGAGTT